MTFHFIRERIARRTLSRIAVVLVAIIVGHAIVMGGDAHDIGFPAIRARPQNHVVPISFTVANGCNPREACCASNGDGIVHSARGQTLFPRVMAVAGERVTRGSLPASASPPLPSTQTRLALLQVYRE